MINLKRYFVSTLLWSLGVSYTLSQHATTSPYAIFGDRTPVLDAAHPHDNPSCHFTIILADSTLAEVNINGLIMETFDSKGQRLYIQSVKPYSLALFTNPDPAANETTHVSPYLFCIGDPINYIDPDGRNPIYSTDGQFLGTDDNGLRGDYYIMEASHFHQNMSSEDVQQYAINPNTLSANVIDAIQGHFNLLPQRPDYDGYLTLEEANEWYRTGNGQPLYVELSQIDLSLIFSLGEDYVGQEKTFNLLIEGSNSINDGLVYGNIKLIRHPNNTVRAYADTYDFDMKSWWNPLNWIRNLETAIGAKVAGKGTPYDIYFYGYAKLTPIFPWVK